MRTIVRPPMTKLHGDSAEGRKPIAAARNTGVLHAIHRLYVVTRNADIETVFLDHARRSAATAQFPLVQLVPEVHRCCSATMVSLDPPARTRRGSPTACAFTPRCLVVKSPSLKSVEEAPNVRHKILYTFETAVRMTDPVCRAALTFVINGRPVVQGDFDLLMRVAAHQSHNLTDPIESLPSGFCHLEHKGITTFFSDAA